MKSRGAGVVDVVLDNPVKVTVGVILVVLFGLLTVTPPWIIPSPIRVPVQLTPNLDQPVVTVTTSWPGASTQESERELVEPQEQQLKGLQNLRKLTGMASEGTATLRLEFEVGTDINVAKQDVSDALRRVQYQIPQNEFDNPVVVTGEAEGGGEIAWMVIRSRKPGVDVSALKEFVEDKVQPELQRVDGIADIRVYGGREREIQVVVDAARMARAGVTFNELRDALVRQNTNVSAGASAQGKREVVVRTIGQYESLADVRRTVIRTGPGGPIRVGDVAEVIDGFRRQDGFVRSAGESVLALPAYRKTGSNVIEVMEGLRRAIAKCNREVLNPHPLQLEMEQVYDETVYIDSAIGMVRENVVWGALLTVAVLVAFLRSARATFVVAASIPISIIATFLVIPLAGRNVNVVMLAGLAFATGMVVDNAIVVLENIYRHWQMGKDARAAASHGAREVWGAVLASSLTTMIVFLPIVFVKEEAGQLFTDLAVAISGTVGFSMIVAVTVVPVLAASLLHHRSRGGTLAALTAGDVTPRYGRAVGRIVQRVSERIWRRAAVVAGAMVLSVGLSWWIAPQPSYLPSGNRNLIFGMLSAPPGYGVLEFLRIARMIEAGNPAAADPRDRSPGIRRAWEAARGSPEERQAKLEAFRRDWSAFAAARKLPELTARLEQLTSPTTQEQADQRVADASRQLAQAATPKERDAAHSRLRQARAERRALQRQADGTRREIAEWKYPPPAMSNYFFVAWAGGCFMGCISAEPEIVTPLANVMELCSSLIPDTFPVFFQPSIFGNVSTGNSVDVEIRGDDLAQVNAAALSVQMALMAEFGGFPMSDPPNFSSGRLEARLLPDEVRAAELGLSAADVGFVVRSCGDGAIVGQYREGGRSYDLAVRVAGTTDPQTGRSETRAIAEVPVATPDGAVVPLSSLCRVDQVLTPQQINHIETQRSVQLVVRPPPGRPLAEVMQRIEEIVSEMRGAGHMLPAAMGAQPVTIDPGVIVHLSGNASKLRTTWDSLKWLLALSGLVVYLLMAGLFESFLYPLVIMTTVPLAAVGGFVGLGLLNWLTWYDVVRPLQELDMLAILGFVILLGVIVNNGILLVHQALNFARDGMDPQQAIVESVQSRIRPILMTSLTTVFGLLPLVIRPGAGAEIYRGLGAVVLGGLTTSTVFTLLVVPAMFSLFVSGQSWWRTRRGRPTTAPRATPPATLVTVGD